MGGGGVPASSSEHYDRASGLSSDTGLKSALGRVREENHSKKECIAALRPVVAEGSATARNLVHFT